MKKSLFFVAFAMSSTLLLSSCGVMFGGSRYNANIKVLNHPNAEIYVNDEKIGTGEVTHSFKRNQPLKVEVKESGCESMVKNFDNTFRTGNFILSVVSWGLLGIGVDLATGAVYKPDHKRDSNIEKVSDKDYNFNINYSSCEK